MKKLPVIAIIISVLSLGFSVYASVRTEPMNWDWANFLVGCLAIITTVLIGWQILYFLSIRNIVKSEIKKSVNIVKTDFENVVSLSRDETFADMYLYLAVLFYNQSDYSNSLRMTVASIANYSKMGDEDQVDSSFKLFNAIKDKINQNGYSIRRGIKTKILSMPIESVSKAIGHSNIKQTQHYARMLSKKVIEDMSAAIKKRKSKG